MNFFLASNGRSCLIANQILIKIFKSVWRDDLTAKEWEEVVASSFLGSAEFAERYDSNVTDEKFVNTLYQNVWDKAPDKSGLNYWLGQLNNGAETRYEALLGFAESVENKGLFTDMTGLGWSPGIEAVAPIPSL